MPVTPYLFFNGRCEEAVEVYKKALGAEVGMMMRFKENPDKPPPGMVPDGSDDKIMHACLRINGAEVMASDGCERGKSSLKASRSPQCPRRGRGRSHVRGARRGGKVQMPLGKTFFAKRFGAVADRFGVGWMVTWPEGAECGGCSLRLSCAGFA